MARPSGTIVAPLAVLLSACLPPAVHPTRVQPGPDVGMTTTMQLVSVVDANGEVRLRFLPSFSLQFSAGFVDSLRDGISTRFSIGVGLNGRLAGVYLEAPRAALGDVDAGMGVVYQAGVFDVLMPYLQVGRMLNPTDAWFVSQGVGLVTTPDSDGRTTALMTTVAWSRSSRRGNGVAFLTAITGRSFGYDCGGCFTDLFVKRSYLLMGLSGTTPALGRGRRNARSGSPR